MDFCPTMEEEFRAAALVYRYFSCAACGAGPPSRALQQCSGCKLLSYCTVACQRKHWQHHKPLCAALKRCVSALSPSDNWLACVQRAITAASAPAQCGSIVAFAPHCLVCNATAALRPCRNCYTVWHCCDAHLTPHLDTCAQLAAGRLVQQAMWTQDLQPLIKEGAATDAERAAFAQCNSWSDFFNIRWPVIDHPHLWTPERLRLARMVTSDALSGFVTVAETLMRLKGKFAPKRKDALVVHLVGATLEETIRMGPAAEELLHLQGPNCKRLDIAHFGPELPENFRNANSAQSMCPSCSEKKLVRTMSFFPGLYQDEYKHAPAPDVIVALNCGLHDKNAYPGWADAIRVMLSMDGVPCVFTSFTPGEGEQDALALRYLGAHLLWSEKNKFCSQLAIEDPEAPTAPFYKNMWVNVFTKKKE